MLRDEARRLKGTLPAEGYQQHPTVKLAAAVFRLVAQTVPQDPNAPECRLRGSRSAYRRAKGHGLPPRYRLFWVFSAQAKVIIFLYLNDDTTLSKEGDKNDPYAIFERLVRRGEIGASFETIYDRMRAAKDQGAGDGVSE